MPLLFVYSPSDFVGGLPDEVSASAAGTPGFTLTLTSDAVPTLIEVSDDDVIFDEIDGSQTLVDTVNIDGSTFSAGTSINTAYDLINTTTGHKITSFHFGGNGFQQGAVDGIVSTVPLAPSQTYTFDFERTSHRQANRYDDYVACFVRGARVVCQHGTVAVQDLTTGDRVMTQDAGLQRLISVASRTVTKSELTRNPGLRPIRISAGALGFGLPERELLVSPQHRLLVKSQVAKRMFGTDEVLLSATKLTALPGIDVALDVQSVDYFHLLFERHEIITVEGAPTESFYYGPAATKTLSQQTLWDIDRACRGRPKPYVDPRPARKIPSPKLQKRLVERLVKNGKPLLSAIPQALAQAV